MAEPDGRYVVDTDALVHIREMPESDAIYDAIVNLVIAGTVQTVDQVFDELKRWPDIRDRFLPHKNVMVVADQYANEEVFSEAGFISENYDLFDDFHGSNPDPADPWLIAVGKVHNMTVVSDENPRSPKKIPQVSIARGAQCISGPEFLELVGIV